MGYYRSHRPVRRLSQIGVFSCVVLVSASLQAQLGFLVDPGAGAVLGASAGSDPRSFEPLEGGGLFFVAGDPLDRGPWVTLGAEQVARRLTFDSEVGYVEGLGPSASVEGKAVFLVWADFRSPQLWRTDGTPSGTLQLAPAPDGTGPVPRMEFPDSNVRELVVASDAVYFVGCSPDGGCDIWRTNHGLTGVEMLADYPPGHGAPVPSQLTASGQKVWWTTYQPSPFSVDLVALDLEGGAVTSVPFDFGLTNLVPSGELAFFTIEGERSTIWVSDGTGGGTMAVSSLEAPQGLADVSGMAASPRGVHFVADDVLHGFELWESDGSPEGTRPVSDFGFAEALGGLDASQIALVGGGYVYPAIDGIGGRGLWVSAADRPPELLVALGVYYRDLRFHRLADRVLWEMDGQLGSTDGTREGTFQLGSCWADCILTERDEAEVHLFARREGVWQTDGTPAGTRLVVDTSSVGPNSSTLSGAAISDGSIYFAMADDAHGRELWRARPPAFAPELVADVERDARDTDPRGIEALGEGVWFAGCELATHSFDRRLAFGSAPGRRITVLPIAERVGVFCGADHWHALETATIDGIGYFAGEHLWRTDGTDEGTFLLFAPGGSGYVQRLSGGVRLRFVVDDEGSLSLWEATGAGTSVQGPTWLPEGVRHVSSALSVPSGMFFVAADGHLHEELWYYDASSSSFEKLLDASETKITLSSMMVALGSEVVLPFVREGARSGGLIRSDGTPAGTVLVDVPMAAGWSVRVGPFDLVIRDGAAYFAMLTASAGVLQREVTVWRLGEGTNEADSILSFPLREEAWQSFEYFPTIQLTSVGDSLYYVSDRPEEGVELWISEGIPGTERLVKDIQPGLHSSSPRELTAAGPVLYFSAYDSRVGRELWRSDGTEAGTRLVHDISPGGPSSDPRELEVAGDYLYFSADDDLVGRQLWALPLESSRACEEGSSPFVLCLQQDRFQVEMLWRDFTGLAGRAHAIDLTGDTGAFWFFDPENVESIVKVLDGRVFNEHFWVYSGSLSNVELYTTITDGETGVAERYFNPMGTFASFGDVEAFGPRGASPRPGVRSPSAMGRSIRREGVGSALSAPPLSAPCVATATRLCLAGGRFTVEVAWSTEAEHGAGQAVSWTADTGAFWFFDSANVELIVKVLDGTAINGRYWVFYGSLSNVAYTLRVTDGATGAVREYHNPRGEFASVGDTDAF
jgi:ELWxxDGT repeat protein